MKNNWQSKIIVIGAVVGAVVGVVAAVIMVQNAEKTGTRPSLTAGDGVKVGLGLMGVLKMLADFGAR